MSQDAILRVLTEFPEGMSPSDIARRLGLSREHVQRRLTFLCERQTVVKVGGRKRAKAYRLNVVERRRPGENYPKLKYSVEGYLSVAEAISKYGTAFNFSAKSLSRWIRQHELHSVIQRPAFLFGKPNDRRKKEYLVLEAELLDFLRHR